MSRKRKKQERVGELMELQEGISEKKNRTFEEKTLKVLIEEVENNLAYGRTEYDAPEVDNECILDTGGIDVNPGEFCMAIIEESSAYELHGRIEES